MITLPQPQSGFRLRDYVTSFKNMFMAQRLRAHAYDYELVRRCVYLAHPAMAVPKFHSTTNRSRTVPPFAICI